MPPDTTPAPVPPPRPLPGRPRASSGFGDALKVWGPVGLLAVVLVVVAWMFVEPAPPSRVTLATGAPGGAYEQIGRRYVEAFADNGIELELVPTAGSSENVQLLRNGEVDAALLQAGTVPQDAAEPLEAVVALAYEPLLVFYREDPAADATPTDAAPNGKDTPGDLSSLAGRRVAIGAPGSGTQTLVRTLLDAAALTTQVETTQTELTEIGGQEAADALTSGAIDAACFVMSPEAPVVRELLATPGIALLDLRRSAAWSHRLPYLAAVTLHEGVVDPAANLPTADVRTVAPVGYVAVRTDTHRAVLQLLIEASKDAPPTSLLAAPGTFPSLTRMDLPVADEARYFFERGPNFLHRLFPFWLASLIDRLIILIVPLLVVLIPLFKAAPPMLRWNVRRRIYRWYRQLRVIDEELSQGQVPQARLAADLDQLRGLDTEVAETDVPLSYMEEFYNLRLHIAYMRQRTERRLETVRRGVDVGDYAAPDEA